MILIVDNYDSFTYNLAQGLGTLGYEILVMRNDEFSVEDLMEMPLQAIVISPGPGEPAGAGESLNVIGAFKDRLPLLGICLGHQVIGACFGGRVVRASRLMHGKTSRIYHEGDELFSGIKSPFEAMRYHSLLLERETLPAALEVIAQTKEGEIMGLRHRQYRQVVGLQFHPESFFTAQGPALLENFCSNLAPPCQSKKSGSTPIISLAT